MTMDPRQLTLNLYPLVARINRPGTVAGRWLRSRFPLSPCHADLIAALAGFHVEVRHERWK